MQLYINGVSGNLCHHISDHTFFPLFSTFSAHNFF
jgi:hypothetical protein